MIYNLMRRTGLAMACVSSVILSGCVIGGDVPPEKLRDYTPEQVSNPPVFESGDRFKFDNQDMTWEVTRVYEDNVYWQSDTGEVQTTTSNPLLPAIEWSSRSRGKGKRLISHLNGSFFPLEAGNQISFKTTVNTDKPPYAWEFDWKCMVVGEEKVEIPMGIFDTFRVECSRQEPEKWVFYYSPKIGYYVKMEATGLKNGRTSSRLLKGYVKNAVAYGEMAVMAEAVNNAPVQPIESVATAPIEAPMPKEMTPPEPMMKKTETEMKEPKKENATAPRATVATAPATNPSGYVIHLASYKREANAAQGQKQLQQKYPAELGTMKFMNKRVDLGTKGIYFRLFAGPVGSRQEATALCRQIKAKGQYCSVKKN